MYGYKSVKQNVRLRLPCFFVGISHLFIISLSLYERIWELVKLEEPFYIHDHSFILVSYVVQILSIFLLIVGSFTGNIYCILPWLLCTTPIFVSATLYAIFYATEEETNQMLVFHGQHGMWSSNSIY
ncbi:hypothetical protein NQ318_020506 [Aromia moschata]|uniref:Uncharacterized protein n=1 Tax=Aromia moschata TaxID=1265417 RepID=A0AAV8YCC5_9CUCU|nr:hypothetical protein NQ318_020506 [Aromia moschata]